MSSFYQRRDPAIDSLMSPDVEIGKGEALRSISRAKNTGAANLYLIRYSLKQLPRELAGLISLQSLRLSFCEQLSDLSPLAGLTSLQSLSLSFCKQLSDLSPLAGLTSLQSLDLRGCTQLHRFAPVEFLLPGLRELQLFGCEFEDLPSAVTGESMGENVLDKVVAHYEDLKCGQRLDAEVKVLFLGNGGTGKTQLCRRLRGEPFDPSVPTTHGIQLSEMALAIEGFESSIRLNLWDFGGQEIYHGSHALFLQGQTIFLILWTPNLEEGTDSDGNLTFCRRPLSYWLDYLRAFVGNECSALLIQSQCDTALDRVSSPPVKVEDFRLLRWLDVSAKTGRGLNLVNAALTEAARDSFERRPPLPIGEGRVRVRERLRQLLVEDQTRPAAQRQYRLLERTEFDHVCEEIGGISDKEALLDFFHHNGVIFYRSGLFGGRIVLDQNWALEGIYALFDRKKILPLLRGYGRFSRADLEALIWSDYSRPEQQLFLSMMESCGICFRVRELSDGEWEYIAPELLPEWAGVQEQLLGRLRDERPNSERSAKYSFLHEGVLRSFLSRLGEQAKDSAIYWKYGCWFYEQKTSSQALIESSWVDPTSETGPGTIRFRAWGQGANDLIEILLAKLQTLPTGQSPEITGSIRPAAHALSTSSAAIEPSVVRVPNARQPPEGGDDAEKSTGDQLKITARPELPAKGKSEIFVSFAWGDDSSDEARKRTEVVDRLCKTLDTYGWHVLRDNNALRHGDLISGFMKRIGLADHVIVVLSNKYLRSPYCMTELYYIYQRSLGEKEDFLRRMIPLVLADARFGTWRERLVYTKHWRTEFEEMEQHWKDLGEVDFRLYKTMQEWHNRIGDMLAYLNDVLAPHGFDDIVKDNFAGLRQMLSRRS